MVGKFGQNKGTNQLRWVILLLAIAVILPTVCLLWFMTQAVKNERLAVQQKLIDVYTEKGKAFFVEYPDRYWQEAEADFAGSKDILSERPWLFPDIYAGERFTGFVIFGEDGKIEWPITQVTSAIVSAPAQLQRGAELEFSRGGVSQALDEYRRVIDGSNDAAVQMAARVAEVRCLVKLDRMKEAVEKYRQLSYPQVDDPLNYPFAADVMRMRVRLAQLYRDSNDPNLYHHLSRALERSSYRVGEENTQIAFPSSVNIWGLQQLVEIAQQAGLGDKLEPEIEKAKKRIGLEKISSAASEIYRSDYLAGLPAATRGLQQLVEVAQQAGLGDRFESEIEKVKNNIGLKKIPSSAFDIYGSDYLADWPNATVRRLNLPQSPYGIYYRVDGKSILCLMSEEFIKAFATGTANDWSDDTVVCRVMDNEGDFVAGAETTEGKLFGTMSMGRFLPGWTAQLYFRDSGVFDNAASRQAAIYMWTGALVILLIVACGAVAAQSIGRQMKLNRLKNDFVATVTHELRTPLASMRVLVDTLLEGNYRDQATATEYLRLVSKENERLSRLIDNFLGFSRMERNKQAFEIVKVSPVVVTNIAAEAFRTKFDKGNVRFDVKVEKPLPMVGADEDAMVTVLVNLLENAYKYSGEDKNIELRVFSDDGCVCFSVRDNGIGIPRRAIKKVFKRFYQVDSSLSRRTEGCGLGLSIVRFIVDAHKGKIDVKSEPGKGSIFTVRLPAERISQ